MDGFREQVLAALLKRIGDEVHLEQDELQGNDKVVWAWERSKHSGQDELVVKVAKACDAAQQMGS